VSISLFLAALSGALVSSLVPFVYAEPLLLALALAAPAAAPLLAVVMAAGQMLGKAALFLGGTQLNAARMALRFERFRLRGGPLVAVSAFTGLPPFYLLSIAAPALGVRFRTFMVMGLFGRLLRFGALVALPELCMRLLRIGSA
jgi:membrane protein YqaA with SNARE-associated domain